MTRRTIISLCTALLAVAVLAVAVATHSGTPARDRAARASAAVTSTYDATGTRGPAQPHPPQRGVTTSDLPKGVVPRDTTPPTRATTTTGSTV